MRLIFMDFAVRKTLINVLKWAPLILVQNAYAVDSYRYLHVTIDTLWNIFLFLLFGIFAPFVLAAWLYWLYAKRSTAKQSRTTKTDQPGSN